MMTPALRELVGRSTVGFLWRQWVQLGVSGDEGPPDRWAIDPEALLAITLRIGGRDPRLFDEVLDWLALNGKAISVQRLTNLTRYDASSRALADAGLAWAGSRNPALHGWRSRKPSARADPGLLPGPVRIGQPDPILAEYGVRWPRVEPSGKSRVPDTTMPAAFAFKLRAFFGIGTRSEIVRFFLTALEPNVTAQRVAEVTAFAKRNVHETLSALSDAGPLIAERRANELFYYLHPSGWADVLDITYDDPLLGFPEFLDWAALVHSLVPLMLWLDTSTELSPYLQASGARELTLRIETELGRLGVRIPSRPALRGEAYWPAFVSMVEQLLDKMSPRGAHSEAPNSG